MNYVVHTVGAIAAAVGISEIGIKTGIDVSPMIFAGAIVGGLIPDIDTPKSKLGKLIKPISSLIEETIGHRTFFIVYSF